MPKNDPVKYACPACGTFLCGIFADGSRSADSAPLLEGEHGKYSVCSKCRRQARMTQPAPGLWIPATGD